LGKRRSRSSARGVGWDFVLTLDGAQDWHPNDEAGRLGAKEEEACFVDLRLFEIGVGALEVFVDSIQGGFATVDDGGAGPVLAGNGMAHNSSLSRLDGAVARDFFSLDFFEAAQFGRALWCQGF
jgi:hypothetical protein